MKNRRKAVQPFEIKKRKIDIFRNYEANGFEKNQRKFENFSTLISKKSIARLGGMYEDIHKLLPQAKITRFTHISRASDLTDKELETMLRYRSLPPSMHAKLTKGLDAYQEEIKALIDFTNAEFAKMLPRTATWCKTPKVKPNPRASTNPAPGCLSFQNNILYFNGQPVGKGVFYDVLPSEGNEVTISGSDERILKSH